MFIMNIHNNFRSAAKDNGIILIMVSFVIINIIILKLIGGGI